MTLEPELRERLGALIRIVDKEARHLQTTDGRLFAAPFDITRAARLEQDHDLSERVEACVGRFGRLQDTLGDKLLPALLRVLGERPGAAIDNLDRAERLGLVRAVDDWMMLRQLRNRMVPEYVEDLSQLVDALQSAHEFVPSLLATATAMSGEAARRLGR